jgi:hypothetical protein
VGGDRGGRGGGRTGGGRQGGEGTTTAMSSWWAVVRVRGGRFSGGTTELEESLEGVEA